MGIPIELTRRAGAGDGYMRDLPLERELTGDVAVDARELESCHPMFALRLRLFIDWHLNAGHAVVVKSPRDRDTAQRLADLGVTDGLPEAAMTLPASRAKRTETLLPLRRLATYTDVEDVALDTVGLLHRQTEALGC